MSLIECEDCGEEVSTKADACPNCGCPVHLSTQSAESTSTNVRKHYLAAGFFSAAIVPGSGQLMKFELIKGMIFFALICGPFLVDLTPIYRFIRSIVGGDGLRGVKFFYLLIFYMWNVVDAFGHDPSESLENHLLQLIRGK